MNKEIQINIHTGLVGFVLLDRLTEVSAQSIAGHKHFAAPSATLLMESLAQLGASHVRHLTDFAKHAFLLKIKTCSLPPGPLPPGNYTFAGQLQSQSSSVFSHRLQAFASDTVIMEGIFLFALADYDANFSREILQQHYQRIFACLQTDTARDF